MPNTDKITTPEALVAASWEATDYGNGCVCYTLPIDFGFADARGRRVGCIAAIETHEAYVAPPVDRWASASRAAYTQSFVYSSRDGKKYGASPRGKSYAGAAPTDEMKAQLATRINDSYKRQKKAHAR